MSNSTPTRATPGGCVLVFFGILGLVAAALAGWALYLALRVDPAQRGGHLTAWLSAVVMGGAGGGAALMVWGWRMARVADMSEPDDQEKPMIRY